MAFDYELTAREQARLDAVTDKLISDAAAEGLRVERDALLALPSVRLAIISESAGLPSNYMDEVKRIPGVAEQVRKADVARQLADGGSELHADIARLNPTQRLTLGREIEKARAAAVQPQTMTAEEEATKILALRKISHPATRLAVAREWGLA